MFILSKRSQNRLAGVNPDLIRIVERAIKLSEIDFTVLEGLRSPQRQAELVQAGASKTLRSRHLTGHAVDLAALVGGRVVWDTEPYFKIERAMKLAAREAGIAIEWGGDWKTFKDYVHWQLAWSRYPEKYETV